MSRATAESNRAQLENLKVQLDFCTIRAPISGRISMANVKVGNFVRQADTAPMATINQMAPVYVSFTVPQKVLPEIRQALAAETATIEAVIPGEQKHANGQVTMIENTVDPATGMATIRATMPNEQEVLWPGTLVTTELTLRTEQAVVVPSNAVQVSQTGNFVFVINDNVAKVQPVKVERTVGDLSVIASGLNGRRDGRDRRAIAVVGRHARQSAQRENRRQLIHEYLGNLHSPAGADDADDGVVDRVRRLRLPAAAGGGAAGGRFPDHPDHRDACRAPAPRPWPPRLPRRSSGSSRPSPASRR